MMRLPQFTNDGLLPPGDYEFSFDELRESILVVGPQSRSPDWDADWRLHLVNYLEILVRQLWQVGVSEVFADGSFVEDKNHPNDVDGYFVCDLTELASGALQQRLNTLDPHDVWTWDPAARKAYRGYPKLQLPMWHYYRIELYPHYGSGPMSGITDKYGNELESPAAFRLSRRADMPRAIVKIVGVAP